MLQTLAADQQTEWPLPGEFFNRHPVALQKGREAVLAVQRREDDKDTELNLLCANQGQGQDQRFKLVDDGLFQDELPAKMPIDHLTDSYLRPSCPQQDDFDRDQGYLRDNSGQHWSIFDDLL